MTTMNIGLVQMRCEKGAINDNLAAAEAHIQEAERRGIDMLCFPEMSITGYIDPTRRHEAILRLDGPEVARFVALTGGTGVTAIGGLVEANPDGKPFITQIVAGGGALLGIYRKKTIVGEEAPWFAPGADVLVLPHPKCTFGIAVCADIDDGEIFATAARAGARIVFEAAAPGLYGEQATRDWRTGHEWWRGKCHDKLGRYARDNRIYIAVATQAGRTSDEDFPGGGYVFGPDGACLHATPDWGEGVLYAKIDVVS